MKKRDAIPLFPCKQTWSKNKKQKSLEECPARLSQLALPNLCVVMAVLRDHYNNFSEKQREFLQNLIEKIETVSNKRRSFSIFEKAQLFLSFGSKFKRTEKAIDKREEVYQKPHKETADEKHSKRHKNDKLILPAIREDSQESLECFEISKDDINDGFLTQNANINKAVEILTQIENNNLHNIDQILKAKQLNENLNHADQNLAQKLNENINQKEIIQKQVENRNYKAENIIEKQNENRNHKAENLIEKQNENIINKAQYLIQKQNENINHKAENIYQKQNENIINKTQNDVEKHNDNKIQVPNFTEKQTEHIINKPQIKIEKHNDNTIYKVQSLIENKNIICKDQSLNKKQTENITHSDQNFVKQNSIQSFIQRQSKNIKQNYQNLTGKQTEKINNKVVTQKNTKEHLTPVQGKNTNITGKSFIPKIKKKINTNSLNSIQKDKKDVMKLDNILSQKQNKIISKSDNILTQTKIVNNKAQILKENDSKDIIKDILKLQDNMPKINLNNTQNNQVENVNNTESISGHSELIKIVNITSAIFQENANEYIEKEINKFEDDKSKLNLNNLQNNQNINVNNTDNILEQPQLSKNDITTLVFEEIDKAIVKDSSKLENNCFIPNLNNSQSFQNKVLNKVDNDLIKSQLSKYININAETYNEDITTDNCKLPISSSNKLENYENTKVNSLKPSELNRNVDITPQCVHETYNYDYDIARDIFKVVEDIALSNLNNHQNNQDDSLNNTEDVLKYSQFRKNVDFTTQSFNEVNLEKDFLRKDAMPTTIFDNSQNFYENVEDMCQNCVESFNDLCKVKESFESLKFNNTLQDFAQYVNYTRDNFSQTPIDEINDIVNDQKFNLAQNLNGSHKNFSQNVQYICRTCIKSQIKPKIEGDKQLNYTETQTVNINDNKVTQIKAKNEDNKQLNYIETQTVNVNENKMNLIKKESVDKWTQTEKFVNYEAYEIFTQTPIENLTNKTIEAIENLTNKTIEAIEILTHKTQENKVTKEQQIGNITSALQECKNEILVENNIKTMGKTVDDNTNKSKIKKRKVAKSNLTNKKLKNDISKIVNYKLSFIKYSVSDSEILQHFLKVPFKDKVCQFYLLLDLGFDISNNKRKMTFIAENKNKRFFVKKIKYYIMQKHLKKYMVNSTLKLEFLMRKVTFESLETPKRFKINNWINSFEIPYELCINIDGHSENTVNYITLVLYAVWTEELIKNLELYDDFKKACQKPVQSKKYFYLYGAYHLWRLYSLHYSKILRSMVDILKKRCVIACRHCFSAKNLKEIMATHKIPALLLEGYESSKFWRESLLETIQCVKDAQT